MSLRPWGPKFEAENNALWEKRAAERAAEQERRRVPVPKRTARKMLLEKLRQQSAWCHSHHVYVDRFAARELWELCQLARHYRAKSVNYEGIRFRVGYSVWAGTIYDPETGAGLVMFTCSD